MAIRRYTDTYSADGDSAIYSVDGAGGQEQHETVGFTVSGTWGSGTATLYLCADTASSPLTFAAVPNAAYTSDTGDKWDIPVGCYFKVTVSGSTSPDLSLTVVGDISKV